jgi:hypothetical protein
LQLHFVAIPADSYNVALKVGVAYSQGLANLVGQIPGLKGLAVGTVIDVGIIVTRHTNGGLDATLKAHANAGGKSYGGSLFLDCDVFVIRLFGGCT